MIARGGPPALRGVIRLTHGHPGGSPSSSSEVRYAPGTDVGNRNRGRGGALRGLSPAVVKPGGVRPGVAHQVGGNGEIVPGGEQRRGEAAPEHVRRHLPEPGTSPEHLHPLPDGPEAHSACDHPPPLVHGPKSGPSSVPRTAIQADTAAAHPFAPR